MILSRKLAIRNKKNYSFKNRGENEASIHLPPCDTLTPLHLNSNNNNNIVMLANMCEIYRCVTCFIIRVST